MRWKKIIRAFAAKNKSRQFANTYAIQKILNEIQEEGDNFVVGLYELTEEEIKIIEGEK